MLRSDKTYFPSKLKINTEDNLFNFSDQCFDIAFTERDLSRSTTITAGTIVQYGMVNK